MSWNEQLFLFETKCSRLVSFSTSSFRFCTLPAVGPAGMHDFLLENIFPSICFLSQPFLCKFSSGFVNPTMLLLSCNMRCRWLFSINLIDILPFIFDVETIFRLGRDSEREFLIFLFIVIYLRYFRIGQLFHTLTSLPSQNTIRFTSRMINLPRRVIIMPSARSVFQSFHLSFGFQFLSQCSSFY